MTNYSKLALIALYTSYSVRWWMFNWWLGIVAILEPVHLFIRRFSHYITIRSLYQANQKMKEKRKPKENFNSIRCITFPVPDVCGPSAALWCWACECCACILARPKFSIYFTLDGNEIVRDVRFVSPDHFSFGFCYRSFNPLIPFTSTTIFIYSETFAPNHKIYCNYLA